MVCALAVDEATIRVRVGTRADGWFGTRPGELEQILAWNVGYAVTYGGFGAIIVGATQPLSTVVDAVTAAVGAGERVHATRISGDLPGRSPNGFVGAVS